MKKTIIRLIALAMAASMLFTACSTGGTESSTAEGGNGTEGSTESEDTGILTESGYPIIKEGETYEIEVFAPLRSGVTSYAAENNTLTARFEEETGLSIKWQEVPSADRITRLNTLMQSGEYPEVILDHYWTKSEQLLYGSQGVLLPIEELVAEHAPNLQAVLDEYPLVETNMTIEDGHMYSMPAVDAAPQTEANYKMWINQVYLDNLGLEMPTTLDEYTAYLQAVKDGDANGNGDTTDEIAMSGSFKGWNTNTMEFLMNSFTYYSKFAKYMYIDESGKIVYTRTTDEVKEGMKYLQSLYQEGLMDNLIFTQDADALKQIGNNPDTNILGSCAGGFLGSFLNISDSDRWTEFSAMAPLEGPEGVRYSISNPLQGSAVLSVTNSCEYPEAIVRAWDLFFVDEIDSYYTHSLLGEEGTDYSLAGDGDLNALGEPATYTRITAEADKDGRYWNQLGPNYRPEDYLVRFTVEGEGDAETMLHQATLDYYTPYLPEDSMILPTLGFDTEESREIIDAETALNAYFDQTFATFVTTDVDIDAEWDAYVAEMENIGVARYVEIFQAEYDSLK